MLGRINCVVIIYSSIGSDLVMLIVIVLVVVVLRVLIVKLAVVFVLHIKE